MINITNLEKILAKEPAFRLKQIKKAVFVDLVEDWSLSTTLPSNLREKLSDFFPLEIKGIVASGEKKDVIKALIVLEDDLRIECVLMRHKDGRNTVCVSSQVGCPLGCFFCATGKMGFQRNLTASEIIEQVLFFSRYLKKEKSKVTNVVFMGMGEPFLNYDNVFSAIKILNDKEGFNLGARRISVSTVGIKGGIKKMAEESLEINLAISLHAAEDKLRSSLIPADKNYRIPEIIKDVDLYIKKTGRKVMFEYIMIKNVNDSDDCAKRLSELMKKPLYFVNLISYNPTGVFQPSSSARIKKFKEVLEENKIPVTQRYAFGGKICAACGQLAAKSSKK